MDVMAGAPYLRTLTFAGPITHRRNAVTWEWLPVEPWINRIHPEDLEWFEDQWADMDRWNYRYELEMRGQ